MEHGRAVLKEFHLCHFFFYIYLTITMTVKSLQEDRKLCLTYNKAQHFSLKRSLIFTEMLLVMTSFERGSCLPPPLPCPRCSARLLFPASVSGRLARIVKLLLPEPAGALPNAAGVSAPLCVIFTLPPFEGS